MNTRVLEVFGMWAMVAAGFSLTVVMWEPPDDLVVAWMVLALVAIAVPIVRLLGWV